MPGITLITFTSVPSLVVSSCYTFLDAIASLLSRNVCHNLVNNLEITGIECMYECMSQFG